LRKVGKVLFVLAILSFIVIFALKMENNMEMKQYYSEKEEKAKAELEVLNEANGQQVGFEITDKEIQVINTATSFMTKMGEFSDWCTNNFEGTNVENCYNVFEDYVNSNNHIIPEIEEIMNK